ncbi:MAG: hypothetical protein KJO85_01375 [Gammaproteobacteria bacterium]|nr:hypothetical protein [Gammaproteobacteria bacterium]NNE04327.1 hypothetical protein [Xanthomonadales bacterium]
MPDKPSHDTRRATLPFESSDPAEQKLWSALGELPRGEPSDELRRNFYRELEAASEPRLAERLRNWLGLGSNSGWLTVAACVLLGFGIAHIAGNESAPAMPGSDRLAALEQNIALLNRELVLDRLQASAPATRLSGVYKASMMAEQDQEIVQALLQLATGDQALSVRSAAIDALGSQLGESGVDNELMKLLEASESPIVQLALVDLVLRHGNGQQISQLQKLAEQQRLHPDLVNHVNNSLRSETI